MSSATRNRDANEAIRAVGVLAAFLLGNAVVRNEDELDALFDAVIELLEQARDERWRLLSRPTERHLEDPDE